MKDRAAPGLPADVRPAEGRCLPTGRAYCPGMALRAVARAVPAATFVLALALVACGASGCDGFDAQSDALVQGSSVTVTVEVVDGRLTRSVDVSGGYYSQPLGDLRSEPGRGVTSPSPYLRASGRQSATIVRRPEGLVMTVAGQSFSLEGPLGCD